MFGWRLKLDGIRFRSLDKRNGVSLKRELTEEEILEALMLCRKDKTLCHDSFDMFYLKILACNESGYCKAPQRIV